MEALEVTWWSAGETKYPTVTFTADGLHDTLRSAGLEVLGSSQVRWPRRVLKWMHRADRERRFKCDICWTVDGDSPCRFSNAISAGLSKAIPDFDFKSQMRFPTVDVDHNVKATPI